MRSRRILVAPINWGLGHATRCIPLIKKLEEKGFTPIIASDGAALELLKKEFPHLKAFELPSYNITYTSRGSLLKWKLLLDSPHILKNIKKEKRATRILVEKLNLHGIISDSRFGVRYKHLPNVFITHQLNVLSGNTTFLSSRLHHRYIRKYDECWVPDAPSKPNLSGFLGHPKAQQEAVKYMGIISRFEKKDLPQIYEYMVLLSGPEPQRSLLEEILLRELKQSNKKILFVRGVVSDNQPPMAAPNMVVKNYLFGKELEHALNSSKVVIARSGYTTLMDLAKLEKQAFFIPTPGQFEQKYLAERMKKLGFAPSCEQEDFDLEKLEKAKNYSGLNDPGFICDYSGLFSLFQSK
ncbi:glycosyltransferase family protein [Salinimicrobium sediminilitoris]|uniref:glycosyltransferase family protein n=1 Tax=Salinimicrobium sediminilitoris TaxID=2876715 RepID=UPI001E37553C|nr:glycosyltransferase family protein [Salinimicrobium sediminilitoris]MCC8360975.1 glycosyltransferase [Salinimicrobium sediminilitoris]